MPDGEIILFSENKTLFSWCIAELNNKYELKLYSLQTIKSVMLASPNIICILIDSISSDVSGGYSNYVYLQKEVHVPVVVLVDRTKSSISYKMRFLSLEVLFVSINSRSGQLLTVIDSIEQSIRKSLHKETVYEIESESLNFCSSFEISKPSKKINSESYDQLEIPFETFDIFSGKSSLMKNFKAQITKAANSEEPVLLLGESGCGKTYTANYIHKNSRRRGNIFIPLNVADITPSLAESELFGVAKGAYTDAAESKGFFSVADKGTLFLDEIGELTPFLQIKLLDVLESYTYRRVGSTKEYKTDARFIFATNANLKNKISTGAFRKDLFYRINVLTVKVPSLREHKEDIPYLAKQFVAKKNKTITKSAIQKLCSYSWPGNIRELHNLLHRVCTFSMAQEIKAEDIDFTNDLF